MSLIDSWLTLTRVNLFVIVTPIPLRLISLEMSSQYRWALTWTLIRGRFDELWNRPRGSSVRFDISVRFERKWKFHLNKIKFRLNSEWIFFPTDVSRQSNTSRFQSGQIPWVSLPWGEFISRDFKKFKNQRLIQRWTSILLIFNFNRVFREGHKACVPLIKIKSQPVKRERIFQFSNVFLQSAKRCVRTPFLGTLSTRMPIR